MLRKVLFSVICLSFAFPALGYDIGDAIKEASRTDRRRKYPQPNTLLYPFQFQIHEGEFVWNKDFPDIQGGPRRIPDSASQAEKFLRNYRGSIADVKANAPELYRQLPSTFKDAKGFILVFEKNKRGAYIPQMVQADKWDPEWPGRSYKPRQLNGGLNPEDVIFRNSRYTRQNELVSCRRTIEKEKVGLYCQAKEPPAPAKCDYEKLLPKDTTFEEVAMSGTVDCMGKKAQNNDFLALACNMYFESRGEFQLGKRTVAETTQNRVRSNMQKTGKKISDQCGTHYPKTTRGVVYEKRWSKKQKKCVAQYSWTESKSAMVRFNNSESGPKTDRMAWMESLYQAALNSHLDAKQQPAPPNPSMPCYTHYLSLYDYPRYELMPPWAQTYIDDSEELEANRKPLCLGGHIYFRDTKNEWGQYEYNCDPAPYIHDPEADDKEIPHRASFFKGCLGMKAHWGQGEEHIPKNAVCEGNSIRNIICAQTQENPGISISGLPFSCGGSDTPNTAVPATPRVHRPKPRPKVGR